MASIEFEMAVKYVTETTSMKATDEQKLSFYKYYKQATVGDCNTSKPGMFDLKNKAKWEAWNSVKGMSKADAMKAYVDFLTQLQPEWRSSKKGVA